MGFRLTQVDAFSDCPFSGNPAGVCILTQKVSDSWMQSLASEMNLSETAFVERKENIFKLRWFTPTAEVELCGHATLAAAHTLWELGYLLLTEEAQFSTLSGLLRARHNGEWIELDFPSEPDKETTDSTALATALNVPISYVGKNRFDYIVELESEEMVRSIKPDISALREFPVRGIIVTARSNSKDFDFVSRFFAPNVGVDEDPVTGSAHCCLAPYWAKKLNKSRMVGYQASQRGGTVRVRLDNDRVFLGGKAITIFVGEIAPQSMP